MSDTTAQLWVPRVGPDGVEYRDLLATPTVRDATLDVAVALINPKFPHNVGAALRACALFGAGELLWTGTRVPDPNDWPASARLPREERLRCYRRTALRYATAFEVVQRQVLVPVCVEIVPGAEDLRDFAHPERAVYVFGPEDGAVPPNVRARCHRFVTIPSYDDQRTPYNLSHAVQTVLYDRLLKTTHEVTRR